MKSHIKTADHIPLLTEELKQVANSDLQKAISICNQILEIDPNNFTANCGLAKISYIQKDNDLSLSCAKKAYNALLSTDKIETYINDINDLGQLLKNFEEYSVAEKCFSMVLEAEPDNYTATYHLASNQKEQLKLTKALETFKKAVKINSNFQVWNAIGTVYLLRSDNENAINSFEKALTLKPDCALSKYNLGTTYENLGDKNKAAEMYEESLKIDPNYIFTYSGLVGVKKYKNNEETAQLIRQIQQVIKEHCSTEDKISTGFYTLSKIYEDIGDYENAFKSVKIANDLKHKMHGNSVNFDYANIGTERAVKVYTKPFLKKARNIGNKSKLPIFVLGMPRSGTSMTEEILCSHSKIHGLGETTHIHNIISKIENRKIPGFISQSTPYPELLPYCKAEEIQAWANQYLKLAYPEGVTNMKMIDKMPENFYNIGFIKLILPNATIINCKRHPLDIAVSQYFNNFRSVHASTTFGLIVQYYKHYDAIMKYWHTVLPGQIHDSYYEELVYKQEEKSRELVKLCGLKWEDACLNFHESKRAVFTASNLQVKQPMYKSSIGKWKRYDQFLGSIKEHLKTEIAEYEAEVEKRLNS